MKIGPKDPKASQITNVTPTPVKGAEISPKKAVQESVAKAAKGLEKYAVQPASIQTTAPVNAAVSISGKELAALNPKALANLQDKYGLEVEIRSNSGAINDILADLGNQGLTAAAKEFVRGFDRTSPGYDRYYDRDNALNPADLVSNPAQRLSQLSTMNLKDALQDLSLAEIEHLKGLKGQ